jgi:hypothetical protein
MACPHLPSPAKSAEWEVFHRRKRVIKFVKGGLKLPLNIKRKKNHEREVYKSLRTTYEAGRTWYPLRAAAAVS